MAEAPLRQSAVPLALFATTLMTQTLVGVLAEFGIGSGWPNRHPAFVHFSKEHTAVVQVPARQVPTPPPEKQSPLTVHGVAQLLSAVQDVPRFDTAPCVQMLPTPASVGVVPDSLSVGSLHAVTLVNGWPISGPADGSRTVVPAAPGERPPQA